MLSESIVVEYRTREDYCHCCNQKLLEAKTSEPRKFEFSKENILDYYGDSLKDIAKFEEDLDDIISEYVYETISFFATSSYENIIIENSELNKVKQFALNEVIS